jgi:putative nucleotidyltransferase with HDIG domain
MTLVGLQLPPSFADDSPPWLAPTDEGPSRWYRVWHAATGLPLRRHRTAGVLGAVVLFGLAWAVLRLSSDSQFADITYGVAIVIGLYFGALWGVVAGATVMIFVSPFGPLLAQQQGGWFVHGILAIFFGGAVGARSYMLDHSLAKAHGLAERLATTYQKTLYLIAEAVELRDPITAGHSRRVATNAQTLAARIGLTGADLNDVYWAGLLHDVGKIAVPETILQKTGPLTEDEWELMRNHPRLGAKLITETSPDLTPLAEAVGSHHECWDGSGYPSGLAGESIPAMGRILAIVDVFEALTSSRPYRTGLPPHEALDFILDNSGSKFDPSLVPFFESLLAERAIAIGPHDELVQLPLSVSAIA